MVVWAYLIICIILGFAGVPKMRTLRDYAFGTGQFSTTMLSLSMMATLIDSYNTMGTSEKAYSMGMIFALTSIFQIVRWNIMGSFLGPAVPFLRSQGCITLIDMMRFFYGKFGRYIGFFLIVCELMFLSVYYKSAAFILNKYLNMSFEYAAMIVTCVIALYCIFGGMHAIVVTDVIQFFIFVIVFPIIFLWGIINIDVSAALNALPFEKTHITRDNLPELISLAAYFSLPVIGLPFTQRVLMCNSVQQSKTVCQATGFFACFFTMMMSIMGMISYGMNPDINSANALFYFVDHAVPAAVTGFVAITFLAVIMSSASSTLNAINVAIVKDVIEPLFPVVKEKSKELLATKIIGVVVVFTSFHFIFVDEHILDTLWTIANFYDPIVTIPFLMALGGIRIKSKHYKYLTIIASCTVLIARYFHGSFDTMTFCVGIVVSAIILLILRDKSIGRLDRSPDYNDEPKEAIKQR
jgi:SSS family solute:Na+ symporter